MLDRSMLGCRVFSKPESGEAHARRRDEILTAAEHCFVKSGFHRTTIQSIAADAGMSVGNVYRYFASKDAVVEALVARDQAKMERDFDLLSTDDPIPAFAALMRRQVAEASREQAVLWLEICAEAARNSTIAEATRAHKDAISARLTAVFSRVLARRTGNRSSSAVDPRSVADLVTTLFAGLMVKQALEPELASVEARLDHMMTVVAAALDGSIALEAGPAQRMKLELHA